MTNKKQLISWLKIDKVQNIQNQQGEIDFGLQGFSPDSLDGPIGNSRSVFDLKIIPIFHSHYHTHLGNTSQPINLAVVHWLVSYEDENEYGNDNENEIEDWPTVRFNFP